MNNVKDLVSSILMEKTASRAWAKEERRVLRRWMEEDPQPLPLHIAEQWYGEGLWNLPEDLVAMSSPLTYDQALKYERKGLNPLWIG